MNQKLYDSVFGKHYSSWWKINSVEVGWNFSLTTTLENLKNWCPDFSMSNQTKLKGYVINNIWAAERQKNNDDINDLRHMINCTERVEKRCYIPYEETNWRAFFSTNILLYSK